MKTNLGEVTEKQMEQRERRSSGLFGRSKKYFLCNYEIRVLVGAADLQFELCTSTFSVSIRSELTSLQGSKERS